VSAPRPELSLVVPVHDEAGVVGRVLTAWAAEVERLGIDYELRVYDDGSRDDTPRVLEALAARLPRLRVRHHANMGHGPTILRGYREALGAWVFQLDSDDETGPEHFEALWGRRDDFDLLLGARAGRRGPAQRRLVTGAARAAVRLFGRGITDVNTPYRLVRASALATLLPRLSARTFAPNVIMSAWAVRQGWRIHECPVPWRPRKVGAGSLLGWRLWRASARGLVQLATTALDWRRAAPPR
jgi:glycosyltransferase involved in cell wall biosynthesis